MPSDPPPDQVEYWRGVLATGANVFEILAVARAYLDGYGASRETKQALADAVFKAHSYDEAILLCATAVAAAV